jgi:hypothetical protein
MQNLAGKVTLVITPGGELPWLVGHGAFTDVYQGRYKAERNATPVSPLIICDSPCSPVDILLSTGFSCGEGFSNVDAGATRKDRTSHQSRTNLYVI